MEIRQVEERFYEFAVSDHPKCSSVRRDVVSNTDIATPQVSRRAKFQTHQSLRADDLIAQI